MFCLDVVLYRYVSHTDVVLWGSSWFCIGVVRVLLVRTTEFSLCSRSLCLGEVLCHISAVYETNNMVAKLITSIQAQRTSEDRTTYSSKTLVIIYQTTWRHVPENSNLYSQSLM